LETPALWDSSWQRVCELIVTHVTGFNWLEVRAGPLLRQRT
jgi:hypothetical protein